MCARRRRHLAPEEQALWQQVADRVQPLHPAAKRPAAKKPPAAPARPAEQPTDPARVSFDFPRDLRIGSAAGAQTRPHDLAPGISQQLAQAPLRMDRKAFIRMNRGKLTPGARLDLHGLTLAAAHPELIRFILQSQARGLRLVLVITGKGRPGPDDGPIPQRPGLLKHQVPQWLAAQPLSGAVLQVTEAHRRHGGSGAYYVYLRRAR